MMHQEFYESANALEVSFHCEIVKITWCGDGFNHSNKLTIAIYNILAIQIYSLIIYGQPCIFF